MSQLPAGVNLGLGANNIPLQPINYGHREDVARLLRLGLLSLSGGALLRSLKALRDTVTQPEAKESPYMPHPIEVTIPSKTANDNGLINRLATWIGTKTDLFSPGDKIRSGMEGFLKGDAASSPMGKAWFPAAAFPLATGGALAGYKITDWLADRQRQRQIDEDLEDAKAEYEQAISSPKLASIDQLYDKQANFFGDTARMSLGTYLAMLAMLGGGSAAIGYDWGRNNSSGKLLESAVKQRERERFQMSPPPLMAIPREQSAAAAAV